MKTGAKIAIVVGAAGIGVYAYTRLGKLADTNAKLDVLTEGINPVTTKFAYSDHEITVKLVNHSPSGINIAYPSVRALLNGTQIGYSEPKNEVIKLAAKSSQTFKILFRINHSTSFTSLLSNGMSGAVDIEVFTAANGINITERYKYTF